LRAKSTKNTILERRKKKEGKGKKEGKMVNKNAFS